MSLNKGFTLIELLCVISVLGVVAAFSAPSMSLIVQKNQISAVGSNLRNAIIFARSEAIKRASIVNLCPSTDGETCAAAADWKNGWMVFTAETASNNTASKPKVNEVIRYWEGTKGNVQISAQRGASSDVALLRFNTLGLVVQENQTDFDDRTFKIQAHQCSVGYSSEISVGHNGLINSDQVTCS